jgi:hypothetical protein
VNGSMESKTQSVLTVLAALSARGVTGTLRFEAAPEGEYAVEFLFRDGKLLFTTSNHPGERLAEFLVRRNILSSLDAKTALFESKLEGRLLHAYLADQDLIELEVLQDLLYQRTEELLDVILKADDGRFVFRPGERHQFDPTAPGVDDELFARLLKHRQHWPHVYQRFRNPNLVLRIAPDAERTLSALSMNEAERRLLGLLDGHRPVARILERRKNRIDLMILLMRFLDAGIVEAIELPAGEEPQPQTVLSFQSTRTAVEEQLGATGSIAATDGKPAPVQAPAQAQPPAAAVEGLDLEMVPVLAAGVDVAQMSITGLMMDDLFLVSQIDGRATIRELMWVTKLAEDKVQTVFGRLLRKGYVTLQTRLESEPRPKKKVYTPPPAAQRAAVPEPQAPAAPMNPEEQARDLYRKAISEYNAGRSLNAEELLQHAVRLDQGPVRYRARLAIVLLDRPGQARTAESIADEAFEDDPLLGQCLEAMGMVKAYGGDTLEARRHLEQAVLLDKKNVPGAAQVLAELKTYQPRKGEAADELWRRIRRLFHMTA